MHGAAKHLLRPLGPEHIQQVRRGNQDEQLHAAGRAQITGVEVDARNLNQLCGASDTLKRTEDYPNCCASNAEG